MSVLDEICARKREHISARRIEMPLQSVKQKAGMMDSPRSFTHALSLAEPAIIAEVKKASPSVGVIRADFNPVKIAEIYAANGAACISVLTDEPYFQGRDEYLSQIREAVKIPLLRKDFMLDEYQIYESRALGADCILLIMAALDDDQAQKLYKLSEALGMEVLVEVHDEAELRRAFKLKPKMIGVNNRNLKTLKVDVQTSYRLGEIIPDEILKIAESGISLASTISELEEAGFDGFLVGESLMKEPDIGSALRGLMKS